MQGKCFELGVVHICGETRERNRPAANYVIHGSEAILQWTTRPDQYWASEVLFQTFINLPFPTPCIFRKHTPRCKVFPTTRVCVAFSAGLTFRLRRRKTMTYRLTFITRARRIHNGNNTFDETWQDLEEISFFLHIREMLNGGSWGMVDIRMKNECGKR